MDQLVFKMEEPPELGLEDSPMYKMEPSNDSSMYKMEPSNDSSMFKMEPTTDTPMFKMDPSDLDIDFGPQVRTRSNTWPLPRPDNYVDEPSPPNIIKTEDYETLGELGVLLTESKCNGVLSGLPASGGLAAMKKTATSRRNAWGPSSYADLISQAITSSPEQRLTLSQIYDWMIQNVPYFKDKGDSNSSAGWKNSIRHNLSLHSKFMRVQNEGTGKSSWWMLNPDASKAGKSARRRATSMETSKFEKRRGRVKKKVEALRNGVTPSPSSSVSESLDVFPEDSPIHFQLSPDYRQRASSNASSCGGRLSPIPSQEQWLPYTGSYMGVADSLAGSMEATMKLGNDYMSYPSPPPYSNHASPGYGPPPPYQCPHHLVNSCNCHNHPAIKQQSISPSYQNSPSPSPPATAMGQVISNLNSSVLDDFSLNIESLQGFDCNVDEVIRHELSMEGSLDFNFPTAGAPNMMTSSNTSQPCTTTEPNTVFSTSGQSWVH